MKSALLPSLAVPPFGVSGCNQRNVNTCLAICFLDVSSFVRGSPQMRYLVPHVYSTVSQFTSQTDKSSC